MSARSSSIRRGCRLDLLVQPTSSASVLVSLFVANHTLRPHCSTSPSTLFNLLIQRRGDSGWAAMDQAELTTLPREVGGFRCPHGCALRACIANGNGTTSHCSEASTVVKTPPPHLQMPRYEIAARLELMIQPPLRAHEGVREWRNGLAAALGIRQRQLIPAELSSTFALMVLDVIPENLVQAEHRPEMPRLLHLLSSRLESPKGLGALGHAVDANYGLWRQAADPLLPPSRVLPSLYRLHDSWDVNRQLVIGGLLLIIAVISGILWACRRRMDQHAGPMKAALGEIRQQVGQWQDAVFTCRCCFGRYHGHSRIRDRAAQEVGLRSWDDLDWISKISYGLDL